VTWGDAHLLRDTLRLTGAPDAAARGDWGRVEARSVAAVVAWEGGAQWLYRRLVACGLDGAAPAPLVAALRQTSIDERARGLLVDAEAEGVLRYLGARGVPCVLIKGTARRAAAARYPCADARATRDVDVLLPAPHVAEVWSDLRRDGWPFATDPEATPPAHYHPPPLLGPHRVGVELHDSTGHACPPDEGWRRANDAADEVEWHGIRVRVPSATELLWHGLTHALQVGPEGFRLRYFLDGASVLASRAPIDWDRIAARIAVGEDADPRSAHAWLRAAAALAGSDLPSSIRGPSHTFDLVRALAWRLAVLARRGDAGLGGRLLEEGSRVELGLGVAPVVAGTGPLSQTRRWAAGRVARLAYRSWRAAAPAGAAPNV
jgi:hypothetical protein